MSDEKERVGPMDIRVKICGLTRPEDVAAVAAAGAQYAGFVFNAASRLNAIQPCNQRLL